MDVLKDRSRNIGLIGSLTLRVGLPDSESQAATEKPNRYFSNDLNAFR